MSDGPAPPYTLEDGLGVKEQVRAIMDVAEQAGELDRFKEIMKRIGEVLRANPNEWGDPEYTAKTVEGIVRHGIMRPISIQYAVYEQVRGVVILNVRLYAKFD